MSEDLEPRLARIESELSRLADLLHSLRRLVEDGTAIEGEASSSPVYFRGMPDGRFVVFVHPAKFEEAKRLFGGNEWVATEEIPGA